MSIAFIGIVSIIGGFSSFLLGNAALVRMLAIAAVLGAAAALFVGNTNIPPAHVLLGFLAFGVMADKSTANTFFHGFEFGKPGFWLLLLVIYGVLSAYFAPRLFAEDMAIVPLGRSSYADTGSTVPLGPVSSNLTQSIYLISDVLCFGLVSAVAGRPEGFNFVVKALIAYCVANLFFAILDLVTYATGTQSFMSFIRNIRYTLHVNDQVAGMKRIVGSFTEASSFARSTLGVLGFAGTLWLAGYRPVLTSILTFTAVVMVVMSTSSTGLAGAPVVMLILYATGLQLAFTYGLHGYSLFFLLISPLCVIAVLLLLIIDGALWNQIFDYVNLVVLDKASSDSGVERGSWNELAWQNFTASYGLGVGLGTIRASSLFYALLAGVGIPGTLFYFAFCYTAFIGKSWQVTFHGHAVRLAARNGCLGLLVGDLVVSPSIDQGLFFYMLAALAAAGTVTATERKPQVSMVAVR
ncbi:hypothetical protein [Roseibium marinum]|uniref:Uncharacterized protein n=1 Tax=Roseibium marinum TaxID=281252 RepID=A0A2S3UTP4_9HYPH|nr:hypothetical protein [Roseibium marinum]POF31085.1 hypothetical protein CLV41_105265 [Roseibium marinum]